MSSRFKVGKKAAEAAAMKPHVVAHFGGPLQLRDLDKIMAFKEAKKPDSMVLSGGLLGEGTSLADKGRCMVQCLNEIGFTHVGLGRDDFVFGTDTLKERIAEFKGSVVCNNLPEDVAGSPKQLRNAAYVTEFTGVTGYVDVAMPGLTTLNGAEATYEVLRKRLVGKNCYCLTSQPIASDISLLNMETMGAQELMPSLMPYVLGADDSQHLDQAHVSGAHVIRSTGGVTTITLWDNKGMNNVVNTYEELQNRRFRNKSLFEMLKYHSKTYLSQVDHVILPSLQEAEAETELGASEKEGKSAYDGIMLKKQMLTRLRDALGADVCLAHMGLFAESTLKETIKHPKVGALRKLLPFPGRMCVVELTGKEVMTSLTYRPQLVDQRSYDDAILLCNADMPELDDEQTYRVALPKPLAAGFYNINGIVNSNYVRLRDPQTFPCIPIKDLLGTAAVQHLLAREAASRA
eukprot:Rhum_TRINITY_DN8485_c0_g2::Rhum_TRINITY_DN8485_c0_g2_i1::g.28112::m.28112